MKAVLRLVLTFFTGTALSKWLTIAGLLLILASLWVVLYLPQTEHMLAFALPGIMILFLATLPMPMVFGPLARGHAAGILPGLRVKLLISAILTVLLVALPPGLLTPLAYVAGMSAKPIALLEDPRLFEYTLVLALKTYLSACIAAGWIYLAVAVMTGGRSRSSIIPTLVVLVILMVLPAALKGHGPDGFLLDLLHLGVLFIGFSAAFLCWRRMKRWLSGRHSTGVTASVRTRDIAGKEIDLVLGNAHPLVSLAGLLVPIGFVIYASANASGFMLYALTFASIIGGGNSEKAPRRSRTLWLRGDWSRTALFAAVEKSLWRHNGIIMIAMLLLLFILSQFANLTAFQLIVGVPAIVLGTALSTYLGLALTRGIRIPDAILSLLLMISLIVVTVLAANPQIPIWIIAGGLLALSAAALWVRSFARRRWLELDWSQVRREHQPALRAG